MFEVFNKGALTRNQRFVRSLLAGTIVTVVIALAYGTISQFLDFEFSIVFVAIGYLIGVVVQRSGHGVQIQFSILAALLAFICFFFADLISMGGFGIFSSFEYFLFVAKFWAQYLFSLNGLSVWSVMALMFRAAGIYAAYQNARVV